MAAGPDQHDRVVRRGYDQTKLDTGRHPYREELDRAAPNNPVMLIRTCGHVSICNSMALELAGIDEASPTPPGGLIEQQNGRLTGMLAENARAPVWAAIPRPTEEDLVAGIEHCGFSTPEQHERMVAAGIYPCPQQVFIYDFGDAYVKVLGPERALSSYPLRTWFDLGLKPATGSDAPVCDPNPFPNVYTMLTRKTWRGTVMDEAQCVSIDEALQAYTEFGAFSQKQEAVKGRLVPGYLADVAVFSRNLLTAAPEEILKDTRCDLTILNGKVVFDRAAQKA